MTHIKRIKVPTFLLILGNGLKILCLVTFIIIAGWAQAQDFSSSEEEAIEKMTSTLNLTPQQVSAVKSIIAENMIKRKQLLQSLRQQLVTDQAIVKEQMDKLKQTENQKLSQVLTQAQMDKWIERQNLQEMLNPDQTDGFGNSGSGAGHGHIRNQIQQDDSLENE